MLFTSNLAYENRVNNHYGEQTIIEVSFGQQSINDIILANEQ